MNFNLLGLGAYLPASVFTNDEMAKIVDTNHEWIHSRSGIASRRFVTEENTHDLAIQAAQSALKDAKLDATQIDAIIVATFTPTAVTPSVACMVADGLECREDVLAFDLNGACTGFIYGLETAYGLLHNPAYQNILVIGAEVISKVLDFSDRRTCILFGDGAGAAVVSSKGTGQKLWSKAYRKHDVKNSLFAPGLPVNNPLVRHPSLPQVVAMDGTSVFQFACEAILETIRQFSAETGLTLDDIDHVVLHQANQRILNNIAKTHKQNNAKFVSVIEEMGNTSAASIAIAMTRLKEENRLLPGQTVLMIGFGAGLTYGAFALRIEGGQE